MIRLNENTGLVPSKQLVRDMGTLLDAMTREGTMVRTAPLRPTAEAVRVRQRHGQVMTTDGPFVETNEVVGGFAILQAETMKDAVELTKRFLRIHGDEWDIEIEVRPYGGPEFGADVSGRDAGAGRAEP
jgi:hypothetical protein